MSRFATLFICASSAPHPSVRALQAAERGRPVPALLFRDMTLRVRLSELVDEAGVT
jgi:hypothetical protein